MTTLAQAEWLKRLVSHDKETTTRHPHLHSNDIRILLYGEDGRGGMMAGISHMLTNSLAKAIAPDSQLPAKAVLDQATQRRMACFPKNWLGAK